MRPGPTGRKQARAAEAAICPNGSVTLSQNLGNDVTLRMARLAIEEKPSTSHGLFREITHT
jgi:hypothetical protein